MAYLSSKDGKSKINFDRALSDQFESTGSVPKVYFVDGVSYPVIRINCNWCIGCKLRRTHETAVRCVHEASCYEDNCFLTLTYDDEHLPSDGSLKKDHYVNFLKRLRKRFPDRKIRYLGCGEYGDKLGRPHFHFIIFNCDFHDKKVHKLVKGVPLYTSDNLSKIWTFGFAVIGAVTFESAAYVARYCFKKVCGPSAVDHYGGREPEFSTRSLKPGLGEQWFRKYWRNVYDSDSVISRGHHMKPPAYYDLLLSREDPELFEQIKAQRNEAQGDDLEKTPARLVVKEKVKQARLQSLKREVDEEMRGQYEIFDMTDPFEDFLCRDDFQAELISTA